MSYRSDHSSGAVSAGHCLLSFASVVAWYWSSAKGWPNFEQLRFREPSGLWRVFALRGGRGNRSYEKDKHACVVQAFGGVALFERAVLTAHWLCRNAAEALSKIKPKSSNMFSLVIWCTSYHFMDFKCFQDEIRWVQCSFLLQNGLGQRCRRCTGVKTRRWTSFYC